jgi:hypothetical protein
MREKQIIVLRCNKQGEKEWGDKENEKGQIQEQQEEENRERAQ